MVGSTDPEVRCIRCGRTYSTDAWRALPEVRTLSGTDLVAHVVSWPPDCLVEVRACHTCGRRIARTQRRAAPNPRG